MIQKFAGSEGHCISSQSLEVAEWLAERILLSHYFQQRESQIYHKLCILSAGEILAKQVRSCPCFSRTMACVPQEGHSRSPGVDQSPPLFFPGATVHV